MTFQEHKKNEREKKARREEIGWTIVVIVVFAAIALINSLVK